MMLSSCSKRNSSLIIGKWQMQGQNTVIEFKSDGTLINQDGSGMQNGKYTFSDDTHMKVEITPPKGGLPPGANMPDSITIDCVVKVNGDKLEMEVTPPSSPASQAPPPKHTLHLKRAK